MRAFIALVLASTGCTLVVGTEPRYVADGGVADDGVEADAASCTKKDCQDAFNACTAKCSHDPPQQQKPCNDACTSDQHNCNDGCS